MGRFIRERAQAEGGRIPPVLCLTATAKPEVVADILEHFRAAWGREASEPEYLGSVRCDTWEVVVPELVFA